MKRRFTVKVRNNNMKIVIIYTLQTDGDYSLDNPKKFGCIKEDVYHYSGTVEIVSDKKILLLDGSKKLFI